MFLRAGLEKLKSLISTWQRSHIVDNRL